MYHSYINISSLKIRYFGLGLILELPYKRYAKYLPICYSMMKILSTSHRTMFFNLQ